MHVQCLESVLNRQGIHDRGQHAHVIPGDAVHTGSRQSLTPENIAAADDNGNLDALLSSGCDFAGNPLNDPGLDPVIQFPHQRFTTELEQNATVLNRTVIHTMASLLRWPMILA